jgi:uncharacterized protein (DUF302 family)
MYYFSKFVSMGFQEAVAATREALKRHHFEVLPEVDMRSVLRKCLAVEFRPYLILCACNPQLTHRAIDADDKIGSISLCNVIVQQHGGGRVEVSAADPAASFGTINNIELSEVVRDLRSLVQRVIDDVGSLPASGRVLRGRVGKWDRELQTGGSMIRRPAAGSQDNLAPSLASIRSETSSAPTRPEFRHSAEHTDCPQYP